MRLRCFSCMRPTRIRFQLPHTTTTTTTISLVGVALEAPWARWLWWYSVFQGRTRHILSFWQWNIGPFGWKTLGFSPSTWVLLGSQSPQIKALENLYYCILVCISAFIKISIYSYKVLKQFWIGSVRYIWHQYF